MISAMSHAWRVSVASSLLRAHWAGYVIKFGLLDPELMQKMRERLFAGSAEFGGRIASDDPSTWVGPLLPEEE